MDILPEAVAEAVVILVGAVAVLVAVLVAVHSVAGLAELEAIPALLGAQVELAQSLTKVFLRSMVEVAEADVFFPVLAVRVADQALPVLVAVLVVVAADHLLIRILFIREVQADHLTPRGEMVQAVNLVAAVADGLLLVEALTLVERAAKQSTSMATPLPAPALAQLMELFRKEASWH